MKEQKVFLIAKFLSEVHSHSLCPFYSEISSTFWQELESTNANPDDVDKDFFIRMAEKILQSINELSADNTSDCSAKVE